MDCEGEGMLDVRGVFYFKGCWLWMVLFVILCVGLFVGCGVELFVEEYVCVLVQMVKMVEFVLVILIIGDIQVWVQVDQLFCVGGKIVECLVDVGDYVVVGQVLVWFDLQDQCSNVENVQVVVVVQQVQLKFVDFNYQWQKVLLFKGYISQSEYDQVLVLVCSVQSLLKVVQVQLVNVCDLFFYIELCVFDVGVIIVCQVEVGQVVQVIVLIFILVCDGECDVVFNVYELLFSYDVDGQWIIVSLFGKLEVIVSGKVCEIILMVDECSGMLKVKVGFDLVLVEMSFGSVVNVSVVVLVEYSVVLFWLVLFKVGEQLVVWLFDQ